MGRHVGQRAHLPTLRLVAHGFPGCSHRHYRRRSNPAGPNRDPESYMNTPAVEIENLSVTLPGPNKSFIQAVKEWWLTLTPGTACGIVGESVPGKSVPARSLLRLTGGNVTADSLNSLGTDATRLTEKQWREIRGNKVAMILQDALNSLD